MLEQKDDVEINGRQRYFNAVDKLSVKPVVVVPAADDAAESAVSPRRKHSTQYLMVLNGLAVPLIAAMIGCTLGHDVSVGIEEPVDFLEIFPTDIYVNITALPVQRVGIRECRALSFEQYRLYTVGPEHGEEFGHDVVELPVVVLHFHYGGAPLDVQRTWRPDVLW